MSSKLVAHGQPAGYLRFPSLAGAGLPHATTTRHCPGIASFSEPISPQAPKPPFRAEAVSTLASAGLAMHRVSYARQVHGAEVGRAPEGGGFAGLVDILTTTERGVPRAFFTADCLAIVLYDPGAGVLGLAHVGWRGTVRGTTQAAVRSVCEQGGIASRLRVAIAPSIGPCCYEVDEPVTAEFERVFGQRWTGGGAPPGNGHVVLDLWAANTALPP